MTIRWHDHMTVGDVLGSMQTRDSEWLVVSQAVYQQVQIGKSYKINGRSCRVLEKAESSGQKSAVGLGMSGPMIRVEWK